MALICGGICAAIQLFPRDYDREANPAKYQAWIADMEKYRQEYPDTPPLTAEDFASARVSAAIESINTNQAINRIKSRFMIAAFYCTIFAFAMNVLTLAMRLF